MGAKVFKFRKPRRNLSYPRVEYWNVVLCDGVVESCGTLTSVQLNELQDGVQFRKRPSTARLAQSHDHNGRTRDTPDHSCWDEVEDRRNGFR